MTPLDKKYIPPSQHTANTLQIYERLSSKQLSDHFNSIFHDYLSAFRAFYGCQTSLLRMVEYWKKALDQNMYAWAVLMDLSKTFVCIPHDLLLAKLQVNLASVHSCSLLASYLLQRHQRVKLGIKVNSWLEY